MYAEGAGCAGYDEQDDDGNRVHEGVVSRVPGWPHACEVVNGAVELRLDAGVVEA